jgi:antitoxin ParD1/3/4
MANTSISLNQHFEKFITDLIASGRYGTASEVVRSALRLLEEAELEYQRKLTALQDALIAGEESGVADDYSLEALNQQLDTE